VWKLLLRTLLKVQKERWAILLPPAGLAQENSYEEEILLCGEASVEMKC
jgi:hypothetical protein